MKLRGMWCVIMAQVLDAHAMQSINHNFPIMLQGGESINPGSGAVNDTHYVRYQNYLRAFGRSFKSQFASYGSVQYRSNDLHFMSVDPLDHETTNIFAGGQDIGTYYSGTMSLDYDGRLRLERAFRGGDLQWTNSANNVTQTLTSNHKGPAHRLGVIFHKRL